MFPDLAKCWVWIADHREVVSTFWELTGGDCYKAIYQRKKLPLTTYLKCFEGKTREL